jgi:hypothetical protein
MSNYNIWPKFMQEDYDKLFKPRMQGKLPDDRLLFKEIKELRNCESRNKQHVIEDGECFQCYYKEVMAV